MAGKAISSDPQKRRRNQGEQIKGRHCFKKEDLKRRWRRRRRRRDQAYHFSFRKEKRKRRSKRKGRKGQVEMEPREGQWS